jgi:hypothetical protein
MTTLRSADAADNGFGVSLGNIHLDLNKERQSH